MLTPVVAVGSLQLGISAKSVHAPTGAELGRRLKARRDRFDLVRQASRILYDPARLADAQHRTVWCHRSVKNVSEKAYIWRRQDRSSSRMTGVTTCGNVWTCPVCSARVAERRREEVEAAMKAWIATGGYVYLLTLTFPHDREHALAELVLGSKSLFAKALQRFKNSRAYKRILGTPSKPGQYGRAGSIRSMEITWGDENGWHPHTHDLVFAAPGLEHDQGAIDELKGAWISALMKSGLGEQGKVEWMWKYALDLRGGQYAAEYVNKFGHDCKWGVSSEITRQHAKAGMRTISDHRHVTPFQILAWAASGDGEAHHLFREYAAAMEGKRMLYWSPGLKGRFNLAELDDDELAGADGPDLDPFALPVESMVAEISADELALVTSRHALGELLELVCLIDDPDRDHIQAVVGDFLESLRERSPSGKATIRVKRWQAPGFSVREGVPA